MPFNYCRTKRPHEALLDLYIGKNLITVERRRESAERRTSMEHLPLLFLSLIPPLAGNSVWLLVCLGQAPAKE